MKQERVVRGRMGRLARFAKEQRGTAGLLFALAAIPVFVLAGGVIDYVYLQNEKEKLQNAADAATLATMNLQDPTDDEIRASVISYLRSNYVRAPRVRLREQDIRIDITRTGSTLEKVHVVIPAEVKTTFWSLVGVHKARFAIEAEAVQGYAGIEVAMVLDVTGSMSGSKIEELRLASRDLVDELEQLKDDPRLVSLKVGLVPYASHVNVGTDKAGASWLDMSSCCTNGQQWRGLVASRPAPDDISDSNYDVSRVPAVPSKIFGKWKNEIDDVRDMPEIVPLQDLRDPGAAGMLRDAISSLEAGGWTYIPAGLVWGWRVLSPQEPYTGGMDFNEAAERNVRKVVILMTDGSNTCHDISDTIDGYTHLRACALNDPVVMSDANERMRRLCHTMHDRGILIAAVAYEVTDQTSAADSIRDLMEECGNFGYYTPQQGELRQVFRSIARRLAKLHLTR